MLHKDVIQSCRVVQPTDSEFKKCSLVLNTNANTVPPSSILYCATTESVKQAIQYVSKNNLHFAVRSGGHSYEGTSMTKEPNGVLIDVSEMKSRSFSDNYATFGPGCTLFEVFEFLNKYNRVIPAATNMTVAISGLTLGGGQGLLCRKYGLTCDSLTELEIVLADGTITKASSQHNPDLFWAHQGAGHANFGIVTSMTFLTYPNDDNAVTFSLYWSEFDEFTTVFDTWQRILSNATDDITMQFSIEQKYFAIAGLYLGTEEELLEIIKPLTELGSPYVATNKMSIMQAVLKFSGYQSFEQIKTLDRENSQGYFKVKSLYANDFLSKESTETIKKFMLKETMWNNSISFMSMGGSVNKVKSNHTAFFHRNSLYMMQITISFDESCKQNALKWQKQLYAELNEKMGSNCYPNCPDDDLCNPGECFYGDNLKKLKQIKSEYDPHGLFQSTI